MADIIESTFASGADKALVLQNAELLGTLNIGGDWTRLVVAASLAFEADANFGMPTKGWGIGLTNSSGTRGSRLEDTGHWIGWYSELDALVYAPSNYVRFYENNQNARFAYYQGASRVWYRPLSWYNGYVNDADMVSWFHQHPAGRAGIAVQFYRGTSSISVDVCVVNASGGYTFTDEGLRDAEFWAGLDAMGFTALQSAWNQSIGGMVHKIDNTSSASTPVDEATYGALDTVSVFWPLVTQKMVIYAVGAAKWA